MRDKSSSKFRSFLLRQFIVLLMGHMDLSDLDYVLMFWAQAALSKARLSLCTILINIQRVGFALLYSTHQNTRKNIFGSINHFVFLVFWEGYSYFKK